MVLKILVINPISISKWDTLDKDIVLKYITSNTKVDFINLKDAPETIECFYDDALTAPLVAKAAYNAEKDGYNAIVIGCFDDPGLDASREKVSIPVLGIGETSMTIACLLGHKFAIISVGSNSRAIYERRALELGLINRLAYSCGIESKVLDLRKNENKIKEMIYKEAKKAIEEFGAEVIVLGCGGMIGFSEDLNKMLNVPVIDPLSLTIKIAETLAILGLKHSKAWLYNVPKHKR
jgi:allantoin racemase